MRVGLTLSGDLLNDDGAKFAAQHNAAAPSRISMTIRGRPAWADFPPAARQPDEPIPDGMVWNVRYRDGRTLTPPVRVSEAEPGIGSALFRHVRGSGHL
jgi:hypothetical protein